MEEILKGVVGGIVLLLIFAIVSCVYFAPTIIAVIRKHHYKWVIFAINLIFGLSGMGYLIALIWAVWPKETTVGDAVVNDVTTNKEKSGNANLDIGITEPSKEFSFDLPNGVSSKRTKDDGLYQTEISTQGILLMIQESEDIDFSKLQDSMVDILLEDDVTEGYEITKTTTEKKLADGTSLIGKKAIAKLGDKEKTCNVFPASSKNMNLFIVHLIYHNASPKDEIIGETFWKTFRIST